MPGCALCSSWGGYGSVLLLSLQLVGGAISDESVNHSGGRGAHFRSRRSCRENHRTQLSVIRREVSPVALEWARECVPLVVKRSGGLHNNKHLQIV